MKGASAETNIWKIRLQLMKPVTWIPLIWGGCHSCCSAVPAVLLLPLLVSMTNCCTARFGRICCSWQA